MSNVFQVGNEAREGIPDGGKICNGIKLQSVDMFGRR